MRSKSFTEEVKKKQWQEERTSKRQVARLINGEDVRNIVLTVIDKTSSNDDGVQYYKMCRRTDCENQTRSKKKDLCEHHYRLQQANNLPPCKMCSKETKHIRRGLCRACRRKWVSGMRRRYMRYLYWTLNTIKELRKKSLVLSMYLSCKCATSLHKDRANYLISLSFFSE